MRRKILDVVNSGTYTNRDFCVKLRANCIGNRLCKTLDFLLMSKPGFIP